MKRFAAAVIGVALSLCMPLAAFADTGVWGELGYSDSDNSYFFVYDEVAAVFNEQYEFDPWLDEIYPGTAIYVPIGVYPYEDEEESSSQSSSSQSSSQGSSSQDSSSQSSEDDDPGWDYAADAGIKKDKVTVSYKVTEGSKYIDGVSIVNGGKEKVEGLESGSYVKIQVAEGYNSTRPTNVVLNVVLNINKITAQETEMRLGFDLVNRTIYIYDDSIYGARSVTQFESDDYDGEATFDMGDGVLYTGRVRENGKYVINYTTAEVSDIADMDPDAYMEFHRFLGDRDAFTGTGDLEIPIDPEDFEDDDGNARVYVYEIKGDQLAALGSDDAAYSDGQINIRAKELGEYVLSSKSLLKDVTSGANDVLQSGYASTVPPASDPSAPATAYEPPASAGNINAANQSGGNPVTGGGTLLPGMAVTAVLAGCVAALVWKKKKQ